jgi:hypothetical protein
MLEIPREELLMVLYSNSWFPALSPNIRLVWKRLTLANTLAYYNTARITAMKSFIVQAPKE